MIVYDCSLLSVTEATIILVGVGRPGVCSRRPSRLQTRLGGPGSSQYRSMATPGSRNVSHRPGVCQEARGPQRWTPTRSSVVLRISSPGPRLEACPSQRYRFWRSTDGSARRLQRWRRVEYRTWSRRLHRRIHLKQSLSKTSNRWRSSTRTGHVSQP